MLVANGLRENPGVFFTEADAVDVQQYLTKKVPFLLPAQKQPRFGLTRFTIIPFCTYEEERPPGCHLRGQSMGGGTEMLSRV